MSLTLVLTDSSASAGLLVFDADYIYTVSAVTLEMDSKQPGNRDRCVMSCAMIK